MPNKAEKRYAGLSGCAKIESIVRYLGVDIEDALALAEATKI